MTSLVTIGFFAYAAAWGLTQAVLLFAPQLKLVDEPDGRRKTHARAVPLGGGLAVFLSVVCVVGAAWVVPSNLQEEMCEHWRYLAGLAVAAAVICLLGLVDDRYKLRGRQKLFGQIVAAAVVVTAGLVIGKVRFFDTEVTLGLLAVPFTLFWLLGAINSLNLIDGIDGLASTLGIIICGALAVMCLVLGKPVDAVIAVALAGALAGFLRFNFPPASIFLGDSGSMLIGLIVGAVGIHSTLKGPATVALAAPLAILAVPILDSLAAVLRRKLTGKSIYSTDRGHMHHCFMLRGCTNRQTLILIGLLCFGTCCGALISVYFNNEMFAALNVLVVVCVLVSTRVFGYAEYLLVRNRILSLGQSFLKPSTGKGSSERETSIQIQGYRNWDELWQTLREMASRMGLDRLQLDVSLPRLHEEYHAQWQRAGHENDNLDAWRFDLPVTVEKQVIGRLEVEGSAADVATNVSLTEVARLLHLVEAQACNIISRGAQKPSVTLIGAT